MKIFLFLPIAVAMTFGHASYGADNGGDIGAKPSLEISAGQIGAMRIRLKIENRIITATLIDSETARDFVSLLPLTLTMEDLFGREKFGHLPRAISESGHRIRTYAVGDLVYWSPGPDVAIYYHHDGQTIPSPGIITIARIDSGVQTLDVPGSVKMTIELDGK